MEDSSLKRGPLHVLVHLDECRAPSIWNDIYVGPENVRMIPTLGCLELSGPSPWPKDNVNIQILYTMIPGSPVVLGF